MNGEEFVALGDEFTLRSEAVTENRQGSGQQVASGMIAARIAWDRATDLGVVAGAPSRWDTARIVGLGNDFANRASRLTHPTDAEDAAGYMAGARIAWDRAAALPKR